MAEYLLILSGGDEDLDTVSPDEIEAHMGQYMAWVKALTDAGHYKDARPLEHGGRTLTGRDGEVLDGPFAETKEAISGFFLLEAESLEQATELARGCPNLTVDGSVVVRPIRVLGPQA